MKASDSVHIAAVTASLKHFFGDIVAGPTISCNQTSKKTTSNPGGISISFTMHPEADLPEPGDSFFSFPGAASILKEFLQKNFYSKYGQGVSYLNFDWSYAARAKEMTVSFDYKLV